ncbi:MAG: hypothetical protein WED82_02020 [Balneolales bacterium]
MTHLLPQCYDCHLPYGDESWIEAVIPDKTWNKIKPEGCDDGSGILCITCIARRLREAGYNHTNPVPVFLCGTEPLQAMPGDPGEHLKLLREWDE